MESHWATSGDEKTEIGNGYAPEISIAICCSLTNRRIHQTELK